jgi:protein O-GlcNAcase/histone acetyltransferase
MFICLGGLVSDLIRLLPLDSGSDLYLYKHPDVPASLLYLVRPFQPKDEAGIYRLVASAFEEEIDAPMGNLNFTSLHNGLYC